ncbi:MAG: hypothetical protein WD135_05805 [Ferruginibacter sp.]
MKRFISLFALSFLTLWMLGSCKKEYSKETAGGASSSIGTLNKDAFSGCLPINVGGVYKKDSALTVVNFVEVQVAVTNPGTYVISSDTVNGYHFRASGVFNLPGLYTIRMLGTGIPLAVGINAFIARYGSSECFFEVAVLPGNSGGGSSDFLEVKVGGLPTLFNVNPSALLINLLGVPSLSITGTTAGGQTLAISIAKTTAAPITSGTYTVNQFIVGNLLICVYQENGTAIFNAQSNPTQLQFPAFTVIITSITATRVVGTFYGPVKDNNGAGPGVKILTEGRFDVPIL